MLKQPLFRLVVLFFILVIFCGLGLAQEVAQKAVLIFAHENFRDEELLLPKDMLETNRIKVTLASSSLLPARGMLGTVIHPHIRLEDIQVQDYEAIIFIGGSGAREFWDDPLAHRIAKEALAAGKVIGAICIAPIILARAGILKEKQATVWPAVAGELEEGGAFYTREEVQIDGNIITASGPQAAGKFAEAIVRALVRRR